MYNATMSKLSSSNGDNGERDASGRFSKGNRGGSGNPYARRVARLRSLLLDPVTDKDLEAMVATLVNRAKKGDIVAIREVLNRLVGKLAAAIDPDRLELDNRRLELMEQRVVPAAWSVGRPHVG